MRRRTRGGELLQQTAAPTDTTKTKEPTNGARTPGAKKTYAGEMCDVEHRTGLLRPTHPSAYIRIKRGPKVWHGPTCLSFLPLQLRTHSSSRSSLQARPHHPPPCQSPLIPNSTTPRTVTTATPRSRSPWVRPLSQVADTKTLE